MVVELLMSELEIGIKLRKIYLILFKQVQIKHMINYLAYSWIEKGIKIEKSLNMLEKANRLKTNDPFIIDSLGWALFKLKRYEDQKII